LERFLSVFESTFVGIEEDVGSLTRYFDPRGVPEEYLSWLGRWLAVELDETWPEAARREFLARAPELFRMRGTRDGLLAVLDIYLHGGTGPARVPGGVTAAADGDTGAASGVQPGDAETPTGESDDEDGDGEDAGDDGDGAGADGTGETDSDGDDAGADGTGDDGEATTDEVEGDGDGGESTDDAGPAPPGCGRLPFLLEPSDLDCIEPGAADARADYERLVDHSRAFVVLLAPSVGDEQVRAVERIVAAQAPAGTVGRVVRLRPWVTLGANAYLGVNSLLPTREFVLERSALGEDSVLVGREPAAQLDVQSRLGEDTVIS
jgi:phage tail-like protein